MQLTTEMLAKYVGGQMEIQNEGEGYLFRGEVREIAVAGNDLRVAFAWLAKGEGFPPFPTGGWVATDPRDYAVDLSICSANNIGPSGGEVGGSDRLCITVPITGEVVVLYPPDGSKLDRSQVAGL